jgi:hypothetical protein
MAVDTRRDGCDVAILLTSPEANKDANIYDIRHDGNDVAILRTSPVADKHAETSDPHSASVTTLPQELCR